MKKIFFFILIGTLMSLSGCGSKRMEKQISDKEKVSTTKSDSLKLITRNKAIIDSLKQKIAQSQTGDKKFDDAVNKAVSEIMSKLNTSKSSGDNSYSISWDEEMKELLLSMNIGATENTIEKTNNIYNEKETIIKTNEIPVKYIPRFVLVFSVLGGCFSIGFLVFIIYKISTFFKPKIKLS